MKIDLCQYDDLLLRFLDKKISPKEFVKHYSDKYLSTDDDLKEDLFLILDEFFVYVDGYTNDRVLLDSKSDYYFNEDQLRESAAKALTKLQGLRE